METTAVLFDLDNTLVDRPSQLRRYSERFARDFAEELAPMDFAELVGAIRAEDGGGYLPKEEMFVLLRERLAWRWVPELAVIRAHWYAWSPRCAVEMEGAIALLKSLRGWGMKLGIVTNGTEVSQHAKIDLLGLRALVDVVVVSEAVGVKKPDPLIFQTAIEALGVAADETVFVGDHPCNDALGAAALGMRAVWLRGSHEWPAGEPQVHSIEQLSELANYLEKI